MEQNDILTQVAVFPNALDPATCQRAIDLALRYPPTEGKVGTSNTEVADIRRSQIWCFDPSPQTNFIFGPLLEILKQVNQGYRFSIAGFGPGCQIARYDEKVKGHYDWHIDLGTGRFSRRKISLSVQLSDPATYGGGELEFHLSGLDSEKMRQQGTLIAFASFMEHRVKPVTQGQRYSLVAWIDGPPYR